MKVTARHHNVLWRTEETWACIGRLTSQETCWRRTAHSGRETARALSHGAWEGVMEMAFLFSVEFNKTIAKSEAQSISCGISTVLVTPEREHRTPAFN